MLSTPTGLTKWASIFCGPTCHSHLSISSHRKKGGSHDLEVGMVGYQIEGVEEGIWKPFQNSSPYRSSVGD